MQEVRSRRQAIRRLLFAVAALTLLMVSATAPTLAVGDEVGRVSSGTQYACALRTDGTVWCWGDDHDGQLGDGTTGDPTTHSRPAPVQVRRGTGFLTGITAISAGGFHAVASLRRAHA